MLFTVNFDGVSDVCILSYVSACDDCQRRHYFLVAHPSVRAQ